MSIAKYNMIWYFDINPKNVFWGYEKLGVV